ncbi:MAG: Ig-like domain-containing protein [Ferruginibacter sp.]|nr:Ig-like domain-containing protein [Ferruginibacter sp.]
MKAKQLFYTFLFLLFSYTYNIVGTGCAQIGMPTGGAKDTIPPILVNANPQLKTVNFNDNKITLTFNEYIEVKDVQNNVLVSPFPKKTPEINYKLKTVTVKLKDTLQPNTTYTINFGKAIVDLNEGNPLGDFNYVFSTGATIDSLTLSGKILLAETGKVDSTYTVLLYRNADDSTVEKRKPNYLTKLDGQGNFVFKNLPNDNFSVYALKDGDGGKTYNAKTEGFAFINKTVNPATSKDTLMLYAYVQEKEKKEIAVVKNTDKKLRYSLASGTTQDLLTPLTIEFNKPLKKADLTKIILIDTNLKVLSNAKVSIDSTTKKITIENKWQEEQVFKLLIDKDAFADSTGLALTKNDTLKITTKKQSDYGNVVLRFKNLDKSKNPLLQFVVNDEIKKSFSITSTEWNDKLFTPGDYEIRIVYDANNNGKWDAGNYKQKLQPEKAITLSKKISIRANWDNESDIEL